MCGTLYLYVCWHAFGGREVCIFYETGFWIFWLLKLRFLFLRPLFNWIGSNKGNWGFCFLLFLGMLRSLGVLDHINSFLVHLFYADRILGLCPFFIQNYYLKKSNMLQKCCNEQFYELFIFNFGWIWVLNPCCFDHASRSFTT